MLSKTLPKSFSQLSTQSKNLTSTYSSQIFYKESHLLTFYRNQIVKFDYKDLYESNKETVNCYNNLEGDAGINYGGEYKYSDEIKPSFVIRKNDFMEIEWNDGTDSKLNINNLLDYWGRMRIFG